MEIKNFKTPASLIRYLELLLLDRVIELTYYTSHEEKVYTGKVDRVGLDTSKNPPEVVICFSSGYRFSVDKDEFGELVKIL